MFTYLQKIDRAKNQFRWYSLTVTPTLFGEYSLVRRWGRIDQDSSGFKSEWFEGEDEAVLKLEELVKLSRRRGYLSYVRSTFRPYFSFDYMDSLWGGNLFSV